MSDNKVSGASSNSWGLSTLVEAAMGEPEAPATSGANTKKEVAQKQQDASQQDSFEQDGGSDADDFMNWVGAKATSMSEDAGKLMDEGMATVGELLGGAGEPGTVDKKLVDGIGKAANVVGQKVDEIEIFDAETNRKLDRLQSMSANDFLTMGLDEIGLDASKRAEIEQRIDQQVTIAKDEIDAIGQSLTWDNTRNDVANMATQVLGGAAELFGDAHEMFEGHEQALSVFKNVGSSIQDAGTLAIVTGVPVGPLLIATGAAVEWVGNAPENLTTAKEAALELKAGIEHFDPGAMAERVSKLPDGQAVSYTLKASGDIHKGLGAGLEVGHELKVEKKGEKFLIEVKSEAAWSIGVGLKSLDEGASMDNVSKGGASVVIECDSAEGVEALAKMIKAGTYDPGSLADLELPDSVSIQKVTYAESDGGGVGLKLASFVGVGASKEWGTSYGVLNETAGDGKSALFAEKSKKTEAGISFSGVAIGDKVNPSDIRAHLSNLENDDIDQFFEDIGPDARDIALQSIQIQPGDQLKVSDESKITVSAPAFGADGAGEVLHGLKMSYETKVSLTVGTSAVEVERKYEITDPAGLARRLGVSVESLAENFANGQITRDVLRQKLKGDLTDYINVEVKVQHRMSDVQGVIGVGGFTASRTDFAKPLDLYSSKLGEDGRKVRSGVLNDAMDKAGEQAAKPLSKVRMSDLATHVIKG